MKKITTKIHLLHFSFSGVYAFWTSNFQYLDTNSSLVCKFIFLFFISILQFTRSPIKRLHKNLKQQHSSCEGLQKVQNHFQLLFQRLKFLEEACGTDMQYPKRQQTSMGEIQTSFGVVKINGYGEVTVDKTVWNRMAKVIQDFTQLSG